MTKRTQQWLNRVRLPLAVAIAAGLTSPASAFQFTVGDWDGAFDTDLTAAVGWRVQERDADLVAQGNLDGVSPGDSVGGSSSNFDDGNLNFDRGDTYTERLSGTSELYLDRDLRGEVPYLTRVGGPLQLGAHRQEGNVHTLQCLRP